MPLLLTYDYDATLQAAWRSEHAALAADQRRLDRYLEQVNSVYDRIVRDYHADLRQRLIDLRREKFALERGIPREEVADTQLMQPVFAVNEATRQLCRTYYRKLAARLHPDRGGDAVQFHAATLAYRCNDANTMQHMLREVLDYANPRWRESEGLAYLKQRRELISTRYRQAQSSPQARAVVKYLYQPEKDAAIAMVATNLSAEIASLVKSIFNLKEKME